MPAISIGALLQNRLAFKLDSLAATHEAGKALGAALPARAICLFFGEMASGKTTMIKAVCEGLGLAPENVISPTYTLVNIYPGVRSVYHVDLFRIEEPDALLELDRSDLINPEGITLIEWPETALPLLSGEALLELRLATPPGTEDFRELSLAAAGPEYDPVFQALRGFG